MKVVVSISSGSLIFSCHLLQKQLLSFPLHHSKHSQGSYFCCRIAQNYNAYVSKMCKQNWLPTTESWTLIGQEGMSPALPFTYKNSTALCALRHLLSFAESCYHEVSLFKEILGILCFQALSIARSCVVSYAFKLWALLEAV